MAKQKDLSPRDKRALLRQSVHRGGSIAPHLQLERLRDAELEDASPIFWAHFTAQMKHRPLTILN